MRAVLFDLDGVLVDSYEAWFYVVNEAARRFGAPAVSRERLAEVFGQGPEEDARTLFSGRAVADIQAVYDEAMQAHVDRIVLGAGVDALLDDLGRRGLSRAVVTNTQQDVASVVLAATGLLDRLDAWVGVGDGLREKPAPDLLHAALARLGAAPAESLLVGDTRYDREAAEAVPMPFLHYALREGGSLASALAPRLVD